MVDGEERTAVVVVPADATSSRRSCSCSTATGAPATTSSESCGSRTRGPGAVVVYPDGLVGHKGITDPDGTKPG